MLPEERRLIDEERARAAEFVEALRSQSPVEALRRLSVEFHGRLTANGPEVREVQSLETLPGGRKVPVRVYVPAGVPEGTLVWAHGGGWYGGSLALADPTCRNLATEAGWTVISVGYPLSPEHRFPVALEDVHAAACAARSMSAEIDRRTGRRLAVGGDSAGGNLAAAVALLARDRQSVHIDLQVLAYPVLHCHLLGPITWHSDSHLINVHDVAPGDLEILQWEWEQYLSDPEDGRTAYAAPLNASSLAGLPPAVIAVADDDILRNEAELYAARLTATGVPVSHRRFAGTTHGFIEMTRLGPTATEGLRYLAMGMRNSLS